MGNRSHAGTAPKKSVDSTSNDQKEVEGYFQVREKGEEIACSVCVGGCVWAVDEALTSQM